MAGLSRRVAAVESGADAELIRRTAARSRVDPVRVAEIWRRILGLVDDGWTIEAMIPHFAADLGIPAERIVGGVRGRQREGWP